MGNLVERKVNKGKVVGVLAISALLPAMVVGVAEVSAEALPAGEQKSTVTLNLESGTLFLDTSPVKEFGKVTLNSQPQTIKTGFDDTFKVTDLRGTFEGWRLSVSATTFAEVEPSNGFKPGTGNYRLPIGSLLLDEVKQVARLEGVGKYPIVAGSTGQVLDDGNQNVSIAVTGEGTGKFGLTYNADALSLVVDSSTARIDNDNYPGMPTPYVSTISWNLISAP